MALVFMTSGTVGSPKPVALDPLEFDYMVLDTAIVLRDLGIGADSRVLLAQPGMPWAIGQVFLDSCRKLGAHVFCFGLSAWDVAMEATWATEPLTHVISPPTLLDVPEDSRAAMRGGTSIIVAGEPLLPRLAARLSALWNTTDVRRIYGSTEFGTIAYQDDPLGSALAFNPRLQYRVLADGELAILVRGGREVRTGDIVQKVDQASEGEWGAGFRAIIRGRKNSVVRLRDGTAISEAMILAFADRIDAESVSLFHERTGKTDTLRITIVGERKHSDGELFEVFRAQSVELFDLDYSADVSLSFEFRDSEVSVTSRGKRRIIVPSHGGSST